MVHAGGRPLEYSREHLKKAEEYLLACEDEETEKSSGDKTVYGIKVKIPTKGGLARYLGVSRDTLYDWSSKYEEFSYIMEQVSAEQEERLINNGLSGDYNPTIAKVLLTKHGYHDKVDSDITTKGDKIVDSSDEIKKLTAQLNDLHRGTGVRGDGGATNAVDTKA